MVQSDLVTYRGVTVLILFLQAINDDSLSLNLNFLVFGTLFASLEWFVEEKDADNAFLSIPHSLWWAIITMTTVGYGDMSPRSPAGKVVGFMCALVGLLCIALPIPGFIAKFQMLYEYEVCPFHHPIPRVLSVSIYV